jgi:hypothetical protein
LWTPLRTWISSHRGGRTVEVFSQRIFGWSSLQLAKENKGFSKLVTLRKKEDVKKQKQVDLVTN